MSRKPTVTGAQHIERARRLATIMSLRLQGWSLAAIGQSLNPAVSPQAIHKTLKLAIQRTVDEAVEPLRQIELLRLDEISCGLYEKAINGDLAAVNGVLAVMTRRARLMNLDAQPTRIGSDSRDQPLVKIEIIADEERVAREQAARLLVDAPTMN